MPEDIDRTIYKLELDGSSYIAGVESLSNSTKKLTAEQEKSNKALKDSEAVLKSNSDYLAKTKKNLDDYTGANEKYRAQLSKQFSEAQTQNQKLTDIVVKNRQAYELATKAATDFANVSARAANLQPVPGQGKIPTGPGVTSGITSQIAGVLNVAEFTKQAQIIEQTKVEFDDLRVSIQLAEERMKQLNAEDEEFKLLKPIVEQGKIALQQYEKTVQQAGDSHGSLRNQLIRSREELVKLEQAGKGATNQYVELEKKVARLTNEFNTQKERIAVLASDTRALDFGKAAITTATSAFQAYTAVSILAGDESEELQKKTMQLFAAMQLLTALEQLQNSVKRGSIIATNLQAASQATYTAVVGASTGALKAFRLALLGTGIGAAIVLIGFLVSKYNEYKDSIKETTEKQKILNKAFDEGAKASGAEIARMEILRTVITDLNIPLEKRLIAVKSYNELADAGNKIDEKQIGNINEINAAIDRQIAQIEKRAIATAFESQLTEAAGIRNQAKQKLELEDAKFFLDLAKLNDALEKNKNNSKFTSILNEKNALLQTRKLHQDEYDEAQANFKRILSLATDFADLTTIIKPPPPPPAGKKLAEIENVYQAEKEKLDLRLAELNRKEADNESKIRVEFTQRLLNEQARIEKLLKEKKLTKPQAKDLQEQIAGINTIELEKALSDHAKKVTEARQKLNDELTALQNKNIQDQLNLIQDEFTRRGQLIEFNEQKELETAKANTQKRLAALELERLLIGEKAYQDAKAILIQNGEQAALNIIEKFASERKDLSADIFQDLLGFFTQAIAAADLVFTQDEANAIRALADKFLEGKISYEKFQKELTKIEKDASKLRQLNALQTEKDKLVALDNELAAIKDKYSKHYKDLEKQRNDQAQKVAELTIANAKSDVTDPTVKKQVETVQEYAEAIGAVVQSVIQFWQTANQAESEALDRSIALQEKRVSAAQRIADRGNAQYLKAEEDRLRELNLKRENAARKQLGIDAALQASQILVGITGAIAKIATPGIGIAETIGSIAIIIGALATGYGLVKSLQGNQPKLAKGTKDVRRDGHPSGTDTIPAWLNEHEAVLPAHRNKAYHPTVAAIYDGTIPADHLNNFVKTYHRVKGVPMPDYSRIKDAAELQTSHDGRMSVLLTEHSNLLRENNELQRAILKKKGVHAELNIDKTGVGMMVTEYMEQMKINKHV